MLEARSSFWDAGPGSPSGFAVSLRNIAPTGNQPPGAIGAYPLTSDLAVVGAPSVGQRGPLDGVSTVQKWWETLLQGYHDALPFHRHFGGNLVPSRQVCQQTTEHYQPLDLDWSSIGTSLHDIRHSYLIPLIRSDTLLNLEEPRISNLVAPGLTTRNKKLLVTRESLLGARALLAALLLVARTLP